MDDCGSRIKQLEKLFSEYQKRLHLERDSDFSEVHSFGPFNFHQEHNKIKGLLNGVYSRCKQWKSLGNSKHAVKTFVDRQKQVKQSLPIKTYIAECLDKIQGVIRENNLTVTKDRLKLVTEQVGLKFDVSTTYTECFISSDMFYVEVQLEDSGNVLEVKVQHGDLPPVTCAALTSILRRRDYNEFLKHMQGLANLYQLSGDAFQKSKILQALDSLEKDLEKIACSDGGKLFEESVLAGPVGFLTPRQGGQLMHLTYFATPLELRNENVSKINENFDLHSLVLSKFGRSLSISLEQSKPRLLPTSSLLSDEYSPDQGGNMYLSINETNSEELPASFVMHLDRPLVVSAAILEKIHSTLENFKGEKFVQRSKAFLDCLIIKKWLKEKKLQYNSKMAYRQKLPGEEHVYRISEKDLQGSLSLNSNVGVVISRIPFTHCQNVVKIIQLLRQQLVYNHILTSVLSSEQLDETANYQDYTGPCFDVSTSSPLVVVITFEDPIAACLASVEFQVKPDCSIAVRFNPRKSAFYDCGYVSRVIQKCLSIPVTMKYIFKNARKMQANNETPMVVDVVDQTDSSTYVERQKMSSAQISNQTSAYNLLASMIANTGATMTLPAVSTGTVGLPLPSLSPSLPSIIQTPSSSTAPGFPYGFQPPSTPREPFNYLDNMSVTSKELDVNIQQAAPPKPPPIKLKIKKVASNYIIETPNSSKHELQPIADNNVTTSSQFNLPFNSGILAADGTDMISGVTFDQSGSLDRLISTAPEDERMGMLHPDSVNFAEVENEPFLASAVTSDVSEMAGVSDVEGIFQTLPGGASNSPGSLHVEDTYGFDTALDPTFDIDAEMEVADVAGLSSDSSTFDISNVYEPGASTSTATGIDDNTFEIDPAFDLDTLLASG
ncbi:mediator of RNA polymerase II transcription subunit 1-like isoform X2 [Xenia sp. Carnegie-2017]|uniref:mediator of RNA polymerase II transcription subunit 1-like isoform X2 n=1 Tax=Xenia sp. Carnegie-2017 TaxID=2897299 RepID=UPI001F033A24|nr:mediator of RNA polymerase II transcription subunit 1-like isoform X2 [Xenia sp. Carnegie-2017]